MQVGDPISVTGFVTQRKYLWGRTLLQMERLLGFHAGRLSTGAAIVALASLPSLEEFETRGYSQVADHRHRFPNGLDPLAVKRLAMSAWAPSGGDSLLRVMANTPHNPNMRDDDQYCPGQGVPQWKVTKPVPGRVVAVLRSSSDLLR